MWNREPSPGVKKCNNPTGRHRSLGAVQVKTDDSRPELASLSFFICSIATIWNRRVSRGFESEAVAASEGVMTNQQEGQADGRNGREDTSTVAGGFGIGIAIPLVAALLAASVGMYLSAAGFRLGGDELFPAVEIVGGSLVFIGASQFVYIVPLVLIAHRKGQWARRLGLIVAAVVVALLNLACLAYIIGRLSMPL